MESIKILLQRTNLQQYFLFFWGSDLSQAALVDHFCGKCELCDYILLCRIAVEGIVFGGDVDTVERLYMGKIVFDMQAVGLHRRALNPIRLSAVITLQHKTVFGIVC